MLLHDVTSFPPRAAPTQPASKHHPLRTPPPSINSLSFSLSLPPNYTVPSSNSPPNGPTPHSNSPSPSIAPSPPAPPTIPHPSPPRPLFPIRQGRVNRDRARPLYLVVAKWFWEINAQETGRHRSDHRRPEGHARLAPLCPRLLVLGPTSTRPVESDRLGWQIGWPAHGWRNPLCGHWSWMALLPIFHQ